MSKLPIGLQLYSVRDDLKADFKGTLKKVKEMGYEGVEFAGLHDHTPDEVKAMCEEVGLIPVSAHVPFTKMMEDPEGMIGDYKKIGVMQVVIPHVSAEYRPDGDKFEELVEGAKKLGEVANRLGLVLAYHNHDFEFVYRNGKRGLDVLYEEVPADLLKVQLDTCWVNVGGENPTEYVNKYAGREPTVHLKDFVGEKSEKMYELIGVKDDKKISDAQAFELRPVGYGKQDFPSILAAAEKSGAKWVIVEQDRPSMGKTPLECAKLSIEYLKSL